MANGVVRFGNSTDHQFNQALNMVAQSRSLSVSGLAAAQAGLFAYNAGRLYVLNATGTAFELKATDSDLFNGQLPAFYLNRTNHTGQIGTGDVSGLQAFVDGRPLNAHAAATGPINAGGQQIQSLADGTAGNHAATYGQLLQFLNNQSFKEPVRAATTAAITLSGTQTVDGVVLGAGDRVLVKDQASGPTNGFYVVAAGAWTRAEDFNTNAEAIPGSVVAVQEGTTNGDKLFMLATNGPIVLGTTALVFSPYGAASGEIGVAGAGLTKTGSTYDVVAAAGSGIIVTADAVGIDNALIARVRRGTVPTGASAAISIVHGLGLAAGQHIASLTIVERSSGDVVQFGWTTVDGNTVSTVLPAAPSANQWDWTVVG